MSHSDRAASVTGYQQQPPLVWWDGVPRHYDRCFA
jgi:hypothetical protein